MSGLKFLYNLILKDAIKGSGKASGIMSIGPDIRKITMNKYAKYVDSAKRQNVDLDKLSEQEIKYMLEMNKPKGPTIGGHRVIDASSSEGQGITNDLFNMLDRQSGKNVIKTDFGKPFAEEVGSVDGTIKYLKTLEPMDAMKETNKVLKGDGRYKSLSKADRKKIADDESVTDHIFERDIPIDPEDMAGGGVAGLLGERPGYKLGDIIKKNIPEEYRLYLKSILPGGEEGKVDESYFTKKFKKELRSQALDKFLRTGKTRGIVTEGDQHRGDPTRNKLLNFPSTYAALGTYTYDIDPKTMDVKITDKYDFNPAYGSKTIGGKTYTGYVGDKEGTDVGLGMFKDKFKESIRDKSVDTANILEMVGNYFGGKQSEGKGFDVDIDIPMEEATTATEGSFAQGGPARQNFKMGKRAFLKLMGGIGAGIAGLKSGLLGLGKGGAKKAITETVKQTAGSGTPPPYFFKLVEKIKTLGDDVTPSYAVKDKENVTKYKDYTLTEDVTTGEQTIQRMKMDDNLKYDASEYYGKPVGEETYMSYKPGKGQMDETTKGKTPPDEYTEDTSLIRSDKPAEGEIMDTFDGVPDDILEEVGETIVKKAEGGIARMLGE